MSDQNFSWIPAYEAIANALLERKYTRAEIVDLFNELTDEDNRRSVDPFTFFAMFNHGMIDIDRKAIIQAVLTRFEIDAPLPDDFIGIPCSNQETWQFFDHSPEGVDDCWRLFEAALKLSASEAIDVDLAGEFCEYFDKVHKQSDITKARLTRALYWMRPKYFLPFGEKTREYIHAQYGVETPIKMRGQRYLRLLSEMNAVCDEPFYVVAARAYHAADSSNWWPDIRDYDPDMSISQWIDLFHDEEMTSKELYRVLRFMYNNGGDATTEEIAHSFVHDREYYSSLLRTYGRNVAKKLGRDSFKGSYWPIIFQGRNAGEDRSGEYVWRLRPEVMDAIEVCENEGK